VLAAICGGETMHEVWDNMDMVYSILDNLPALTNAKPSEFQDHIDSLAMRDFDTNLSTLNHYYN
jgi:hypothetical protein